jgi:hypothetical protein
VRPWSAAGVAPSVSAELAEEAFGIGAETIEVAPAPEEAFPARRQTSCRPAAFFFAAFPPSPLPEWYAQRRRRLTIYQVDAHFILTNGRRSRHILASRWQASDSRAWPGTTVQAWEMKSII